MDVTKNFTKVPNEVISHYHYFPKFTAAYTTYTFLLSYYNDNYGYAFPTQLQIAAATNQTTKTIGDHTKTLVAAGLIHKTRKSGNLRYSFVDPLPADIFFAKFPEAMARKEELAARLEAESARNTRRRNARESEVYP